MKAWVIKNGRRYASDTDDSQKLGPLISAVLFSTKKIAEGHVVDNEKSVPVDITVMKKSRS